jgi:hypothetical protein
MKEEVAVRVAVMIIKKVYEVVRAVNKELKDE